MNTELEDKLDQLENEVIEEIRPNPCKAYTLHFPYRVELNLTADGCRTEIIINTTSEEMIFANTERDALWQKERSDAVSKEGYIKHIVDFVSREMIRVDIDECELSYTGSPIVAEMTQEELENYSREVISGA